jgi:transcriptional repressor NrdR
MICPECGGSRTTIPNTRPVTNGWTYRRRECVDCKHRWNTYEIPEDELTMEVEEEDDNA